MTKMRVAIIGGGAGGFFAAISVKHHHPDAQVTIHEKSLKLLSKVKISGGGRCNVTNGTDSINTLAEAYPRGSKQLRKLFGTFNNQHVMHWFEERGVPLVIQDDLCVFPVSQNSQSIIDCFMNEARKLGIEIKTQSGVQKIEEVDNQLELTFTGENTSTERYDKVIVATGGSPKLNGLDWLAELGHQISPPVPSLFTFNMPSEPITELMGIVVEKAIVRIQGTKLRGDGPLLITHWGMSGPAVLKLSSFGARILSEMSYNCVAQVNWVNEVNVDEVSKRMTRLSKEQPNKQIANARFLEIPVRLWIHLLEKCEIPKDITWSQLGKKPFNKLLNILTNDEYVVSGKTTFKEEFVTCGGVSLESLDMKTMESRTMKNLYFTGEVIDIDGITGGYNFQAAWTTAYIAGKLLSE